MKTSVTVLLAFLPAALAIPQGYGLCQSGCACLVMACYAAAGAVWGSTARVGAPPTVRACNGAFGACCAKCAALIPPALVSPALLLPAP